ncbi:mitochondrial Complex I (CI) assembly protein NDUFAF5/C20orf7 [Andalucia godoyi]|uniref:Mitochondrial Complex I (CI) assembly protein NDUFAF5/C20orf7 n=1 Tax=Andalucia godoyi TaxID=505711 RepID=A0A8K0AH22_ANDGO|nr:mitochondrial Complex I (CI) assembly protein NDUFAF5/C20orf7 [Andalucia godoyi]|eukprot:ANDGO_01138.mRNA.1 mitochondrial Complex I (CI) assembly protein NDUFAF5/C20orf7
MLQNAVRQGTRCIVTRRFSASQAGSTIEVFNRDLKRTQKEAVNKVQNVDDYRYLKKEIVSRLVDRLEDISRAFPKVLNLGGPADLVAPALAGSRSSVAEVVSTDMSQAALDRAVRVMQDEQLLPASFKHSTLVVDEESLPFEENTFDAVLSPLCLHWVNDIPGSLIQIERSLKPDGLFLGAMLGGDTLKELRISLTLAQQERESGLAAYISPMAGFRDAGNLLSRAAFSLPGVDVDTITVPYPDAFTLMQHLWFMEESNSIKHRRGFISRDTLMSAAAIYQSMFGNPEAAEGEEVLATFQVMYLIGWKFDASQPHAKRRGTAQVSMQELAKGLGSKIGEVH